MKRIISIVLMAVMLTSVMLSCRMPLKNSGKEEKQRIVVQLDQDYWLSSVGRMLKEHFPDVEFDFVISSSGAQYLNDAALNDDLADIIIDASSWTQTSSTDDDYDINPKDYLYDFSWTDITNMFYKVYLDGFTNEDGSVNWLPGAASVEGILANTELFERYGIQIPYNYETFVEACSEFEKHGIRGFVTDYKYDYTDSYMLQAWSIPLLQSTEGRNWRNEAMEGEIDYLPDEIGTQLFSRLEQVLKDTGAKAEDVNRGYSSTFSQFVSGQIAMIRQSTNIAEYQEEGMNNLLLLPYFGEKESDNWYFSTPGYSVAMNGKLKGDGEREELALDIVRYLFSSEVMNAMADRIQSFVVYNKNVNVDVQYIFANIIPYIESNRMYTYIRNDSVCKASYAAVQQLLTGQTDAAGAVGIFNDNYNLVKDKADIITTFDKEYKWRPTDTGSEAFSVRVNTLRKICGVDMLIAPAAMNAGDIYRGDYTAAQLQALLMSGGAKFYTKNATGREIKQVVKCLVEGCGRDDDPVSWDTLPASSGFKMKISKEEDGSMHLIDILVNGKPIDDEKIYSFCYADVSGHTLLERAYNYDMSEHGGVHMYKQETDIAEGEQYDGYIVRTGSVQKLWTQYFSEGGKLAGPEEYIEKD
ncbi:MAG: extracellular solute-binding protein [Eubacteriales bacterium]|nr:extracellular solute-binding protein [Eubacteriales bacterium]